MSADFAIDKPAGHPCPNLLADARCSIHAGLRDRGFVGCTVYDCFGAGQQVCQVTLAGTSWRDAPAAASRMFEVFAIMRSLHESLWYLEEARSLALDGDLAAEVDEVLARTEHAAGLPPDDVLAVDVDGHRNEVGDLLLRVSAFARADRPGRDLRGADLAGARLAGVDLARASLRGACLIGADLRGAHLDGADLVGADLRGADVRGASLVGCLFVTQAQANSASGDATTVLPEGIDRPAHWLGARH